jgi:hypothetical protein
VAMEQTSLCLQHIHLATALLVTVGTAIETEHHHLAIPTFLPTKEHDLGRNVDLETRMTGLEMVDVDLEILVTRETDLPMIVRTGAGATETGSERVIRVTLEETDEMGERAREVPIGETGHASETETFTGGRIVCVSSPHRPSDWATGVGKGLFRSYQGGSGFHAGVWRTRLGKTASCTTCMVPAGQHNGTWRWACRVALEGFCPAFARRQFMLSFHLYTLRYANRWRVSMHV